MQKFILVDNKQALADAWNKEFAEHDNVEGHGPVDIFSFEGDACVSPANSYGFMDGGIDLLYSLNMGWNLSIQLRDRIQNEFDGELPVGQAIVIPTGYARFPNMIVAPTMRVPARLVGTPNVYLAAKAMFLAAKRHPVLKTIVCPGLGTGTGGVSPEECARVMKLAYEDWYLDKAKDNGTLAPQALGDVYVLSNRQITHGLGQGQAALLGYDVKKVDVYESEIRRSVGNNDSIDNAGNIPLESLPSEGKIYPEGTKVILKEPEADEGKSDVNDYNKSE